MRGGQEGATLWYDCKPPVGADFISARGPCGGANACGRIWNPPLQTFRNDRSNRMAAAARVAVGRDALIPPDPAAGQGSDFEIAKVRRA